ncbi:MAG: HAMP domain-containing histidine kinase [Streptococcaceae bacterium]|jgi:signal transduction histidine kinase|nr:HAMP domain-containing histidine kinase [Streptococcaceae bacterium]
MILGVVFFLLFLVTFIYLIRLKKDISQMNQMLQTIEKTDTNMRITTTTYDSDVVALSTDMNKVLDKQKQIVLDAKRSSRELKQGISNISHDLRTPLTSALGYVQMLKTGKLTDEQQQNYLKIIEERLHSLTDLMKELFDYTKIVEGKIDVQLQSVNVSNLLTEEISARYIEFTNQQFEMEIDLSDQPLIVTADGYLLKRAIGNLLQNVLIHGQEIFILKVDATQKEILLSNKAENIQSIQVERLFERFYTVDTSRTSKKTGLGLPITKELIQQMNGEISAFIEEEYLTFKIKFK